LLRKFSGKDLTGTLSLIESAVRGVTAADCPDLLLESGAEKDVLAAAPEMKRVAAQINVAIQALGIARARKRDDASMPFFARHRSLVACVEWASWCARRARVPEKGLQYSSGRASGVGSACVAGRDRSPIPDRAGVASGPLPR
jgi:hypothetical protein